MRVALVIVAVVVGSLALGCGGGDSDHKSDPVDDLQHRLVGANTTVLPAATVDRATADRLADAAAALRTAIVQQGSPTPVRERDRVVGIELHCNLNAAAHTGDVCKETPYSLTAYQLVTVQRSDGYMYATTLSTAVRVSIGQVWPP